MVIPLDFISYSNLYLFNFRSPPLSCLLGHYNHSMITLGCQ
nr:MAG TPA: hypothetical protein [Caudoviricetes sp.]